MTDTALMAAKICHDLATPLSAMNLLLDYAFEQCQDPHLEATFRESLEKCGLRLQFYRLLLSKGPVSYADVFPLLSQCAKTLKVEVNLPVECDDGPAACLVLGLVYIVMEAMPQGGSISVQTHHNGYAFPLQIKAKAEKIHFRTGYKEALLTPLKGDDINARNILPVHLNAIAVENGLTFSITQGDCMIITIQ